MGKTINSWLKRIFSVTTLTTIATLVGACIAIIQYVEANGGTFIAFVNNKEVTPPVNRTVLVYLDKDSADLSQIGIFPQITNPSKYALQDVLLTYKIESNSTNVSFTDYFSVHRLAQGDEVTNLDKTLYAKTDMPEPFYYFIMSDRGQALINIRATYKGVEEPFTFQAKVYANKLFLNDKEERTRAIFNDAQHFVTQNNINSVDLYILDSGNVETHENISADKMVIEDPYDSAGKQITASVSKPIEQIVSEKKDVSKSAQEKEGTPWYMYIVGAVLFLITIAGFIALLFMGVMIGEMTGFERVKAFMAAIILVVIVYVGVYYCLGIMDMRGKLDDFWSGFAYYCGMVGNFALITYFTSKTKKYLSISDENSDFIFAVYLFISVLIWSLVLKAF